jgi:hypothetical protein
MVSDMAAKNPIMVAYLKASYAEQIAFRNQFVKEQNVLLCKQLRIIDKCLLKHPENVK